MEKQINIKPVFLPGEEERTKIVLRRIRRVSGLTEYMRVKYFLRVANAIGTWDSGFILYDESLIKAEKSDNFIDILKLCGYPICGDTPETLTERDKRLLKNACLFFTPVMAIINLDTKEIQKVFVKIEEYRIERISLAALDMRPIPL